MAEKLTIVTFLFAAPKKWRQLLYAPYGPVHVNALWRACADNIKIPHRFLAITDKPDGIQCERQQSFPVVRIRKPDGVGQEDGCYQRLRIYDPVVQNEWDSEYILMLDLDAVFLRDCTALIEECMQREFTTLRGSAWKDGTLCSWYNGSFQMVKRGARPQFWTEFDGKKFFKQREAYKMPGGKRPHGTDQAWLSVCAGPGEHSLWTDDGVCQFRSFQKAGIPDNTRLLFFAGREKPWMPSLRKSHPEIAAAWQKYA